MSKTPNAPAMVTPAMVEAGIDAYLTSSREFDPPEQVVREIIEAAVAGFVILPREPSEAMTDSPDYVAGNWSRRNWEAILRSAALSPKDVR